jgi:transcription antitermination protein NusB
MIDDTTPAPADTAQPAPPAKVKPKSARRRSREIALQGLYQWLLSGADVTAMHSMLQEQEGFEKADRVHLDALLAGCIEEAAALDAALARHVDRKTSQLSPVEHAALMIGAYELIHCLEIPYRAGQILRRHRRPQVR